jgi:hypothetical protein
LEVWAGGLKKNRLVQHRVGHGPRGRGEDIARWFDKHLTPDTDLVHQWTAYWIASVI